VTPAERLRYAPQDWVIVHELGHLIVGLDLRLTEGGIEFTENCSSDVARAHYNRNDANPTQVIVRGLAGMYCQALCFPESIVGDSLRIQLLEGKLFAKPSTVVDDAPIWGIMRRNGFVGDWQCVLHEAKIATDNPQNAIRCLQEAHNTLKSIAKKINLRGAAFKLLEDVKDWLNTQNDDVLYAPVLIYPPNRAQAKLVNLLRHPRSSA